MNEFIHMCFELARQGKGFVAPNPMVGAIIVKDEKIIGQGFHQKLGGHHAEVNAIENATESVKGATLYCNLEPCCHLGKRTPPCVPRIVSAGIKKVVISNLDPNPQVSGRGVELLKMAGIEVITAIQEKEGRELNEIFFTNMTKQKAFIHLKVAQTLDGKIACKTGSSKWITSSESRLHVHGQRLGYDAIMVGANTVRNDNPQLTVRLGDKVIGKKRLILSRAGEIDKNLTVFNDEFSHLTYLVIPDTQEAPADVQTIIAPTNSDGEIDLNELAKLLYHEYRITSVYVEGGRSVHTSFLTQNAFDRLSLFIAPKLVGSGIESFGEMNINKMTDALVLENLTFEQIGPDLFVTMTR